MKESLIDHIATYSPEYLGTLPVLAKSGAEVVAKAFAQIMKSSISPRKVTIYIYPDAVDVIETSSFDVMKSFLITDVNFTYFDSDDPNLFGIIVTDSRLIMTYCHCFRFSSLKVPCV